MMNENKQTKEQFDSYLLDDLLERKCTKQELSVLYNINERNIREEISKISMHYPVISHSQTKGYRICNVDEVLKSNSFNKINSEIEEIEHCIKEINSRIKELHKRKMPLLMSLQKLKRGR